MSLKTKERLCIVYFNPKKKNGFGCCFVDQYPKRVINQGLDVNETKIIYKDITAEKASRRERELQFSYGYPLDKHSYLKQLELVEKARDPEVRKKAMKSINWEERNKKLSDKAKTGYLRNNKKTSKPVYQYTKQENFIKLYPSAMEAQRQLKITGIAEAIRGITQKTAGGYIWRHFKI